MTSLRRPLLRALVVDFDGTLTEDGRPRDEVVGALALLTPGYAFLGAVWLAATMVGALLAHLLVLPTPAAPAFLLLSLDVVLASLRRDPSARLVPRPR